MIAGKHKFVLPLIVTVLILVTLRCAQEEKNFTFWIGGAPQEVDYWEKLVGEFEQNTGYRVQVIRQPTDSDQRRQGLVISLEAKQPDPDIFLMDVIWIGQFADSKWLQSFNPFMGADSSSTKPFFQRVLKLVDWYGDSLYALPVYVDGGLLYYRTDLLQKYGYPGPPTTWDELLQYSLAIQPKERNRNPNFNGFVWQGAQYEGLVCDFLEFTASNGGGIMIDNKIQLDYPPNIPALQFMQDLIHKYKISPPNTYTEMKEEQVRRAFQQGNALFERNWPYAWKLHQSKGSPVRGKVGISALPHFAGGESASTLGGWHIGISRYSDVKDRAWRFVRFITSYQAQKKLVLNLGWNPGREDVYRDPEVLKTLPHLSRLHDVFQHAVARPNLPYYSQASDVIQRYANSCLAGDISASAALQKMQTEIEEITKIYGQK